MEGRGKWQVSQAARIPLMRPLPSVSLPGEPCPGCHWPGVGRFRGENQASPRRPTSPWRHMAGAAAGGNSWCLSLEPKGCMCLNPSSLEPPGWQVGRLGRMKATVKGWGAKLLPRPPQLPAGSYHMCRRIPRHPPSPAPPQPRAAPPSALTTRRPDLIWAGRFSPKSLNWKLQISLPQPISPLVFSFWMEWGQPHT